MNNYMAMKWITWKKWTDSYKSSIPIKVQTEPGRNRNYEQPNYKHRIEAMKKISQKTKAQDQMASQENSIKNLEKI